MRFAVIGQKVVPESLLKSPSPTLPISKISSIPTPQQNLSFHFNPEIQAVLQGKQLLMDDLPFSLEEIQEHYENGWLTYRNGIEFHGKTVLCQRCGNSDSSWFASFPCARCGESCIYCRRCLIMGRVSACTPLIGWRDPDADGRTNIAILSSMKLLQWTGSLSDGQREASGRVEQAVISGQELLVWAVCGAGKTEILFKGIEQALARGQRVCIATPRTDVVLELTPRLKAVFPEIPVASLYGGSEDRHNHAPLTISTTHQLFRFYHAFDTLIVDEVDAFPFSVDETLRHAVKNARKPESTVIYLTATPSRSWQRECRLGKRAYVTIPARFHRHPLPVPELIWCGNWGKQLEREKLPDNVIRWVKIRLDAGKQALVFAPKIELMKKILTRLRKLHPDIESVYAEDPDRKEKVMKMRNKEIPLLLTTTILERGVTFPDIDVAVIGAEAEIFTESALVQIAGRAGRSASHPTGDVTFFHYGRTEEMLRAKRVIEEMNREATKRCLLD
ncbi:DEAD/DEAH box helicase [Mesobacillus zeae]|uniref:DNA/RNA helicase n=1 Tax=Mesobacillus zeae TaxID=1917180 RepID=A0A398BAE2_9BACI|nr:DEAD/DEAH box helicase [Mesobacillus zeae]RID84860.1 DNA/RNA helicase [Mesobacillus zeae]